LYPLKNKILSIDMGCHTYKIIEAVLTPSFKIHRFGLCPVYLLSGSKSSGREWKRLGYRAKDTVLSFHHKSLIVRDIKLPAKQGYNLHQSIQEEIKQYQNVFNDEYDFDYTVNLPADETGYYLAKTFAVSRSVNRTYIERAIAFGLKPRIIDVQINASQRVISKIMKRCEAFSSSVCFILDLGYECTTAGIASAEGVITQKVIPFGCRQVEGLTPIPEDAMQIITICHQMIDYYIHLHDRYTLQYGIMYGGGVYINGLFDFIRENIPLQWYDLNYYNTYLPEVPDRMDLNLFVNCLGSLLRN